MDVGHNLRLRARINGSSGTYFKKGQIIAQHKLENNKPYGLQYGYNNERKFFPTMIDLSKYVSKNIDLSIGVFQNVDKNKPLSLASAIF